MTDKQPAKWAQREWEDLRQRDLCICAADGCRYEGALAIEAEAPVGELVAALEAYLEPVADAGLALESSNFQLSERLLRAQVRAEAALRRARE